MKIQELSLSRTALFVIVAVAIMVWGIVYSLTFAANTQSIDLDKSSGDYLFADHSVSLGITNDITLEAWIKIENLLDDASVVIISKGDGLTAGGYSFALNRVSSTDFRIWGHFYGDATGTVVSTRNGSTNLHNYVGQWVHVAATWTAGPANHVRLYVNGVEEGVGTFDIIGASSVNANTDPLYIGGGLYNGNTGASVYGKIDEARVWNVARTGAEIAGSMSQELIGNEPGLVGYWRLNGTMEDVTLNNNDLVNSSNAAFSNDIPFPVGPTLSAKVRKSTDESATTTALQDDDQLAVLVEAGKTYIVGGAVFASAGSATPDIRIGFAVPGGSEMSIGYISVVGQLAGSGLLESSGISSERIQLPSNTPVPVMIKGTIVAGATGPLQLQWAQFASNANSVTVKKGSYLKVEEI